MNLRLLFISALIILGLYWLQQEFVVSAVISGRIYFSRLTEYVLFFKDKEPFVFCCLPIVALLLLGKR